MATLPKPDPKSIPMTAEQLLAIRGTPEFEAEFERQLRAVAAKDRQNKNADHIPIDWEALNKVWK